MADFWVPYSQRGDFLKTYQMDPLDFENVLHSCVMIKSCEQQD